MAKKGEEFARKILNQGKSYFETKTSQTDIADGMLKSWFPVTPVVVLLFKSEHFFVQS